MAEKIYASVQELIGRTPLMEIGNIEREEGLEARVLVKLEYLNPAGSVKDRIAKNMIEDAEEKGLLKPGATIIEPTSGNTGIGLAAIAASKGYRLILTMPETMSVERRNILKAYGAEIVLTEGARGMTGAIEKAEELAKEIPGSFLTRQFENPANPAMHRKTTGPEIWEDTDGKVDILVAGVGTGGTITGTGEYLKSKNPQVKVVAVEPSDSPVLSKGTAGPHKIQGIGAGFVPKALNTQIYDEILALGSEESFAAAKLLAFADRWMRGVPGGIVRSVSAYRSRWRTLGATTVFSALLLHPLLILAMFFALYGELGHLPEAGTTMTAVACGSVAAAVPVTPGGIGTRDAVITTLLSAWGMPESSAATAMILYTAMLLLLDLLCGIAFFLPGARGRGPVVRSGEDGGETAHCRKS